MRTYRRARGEWTGAQEAQKMYLVMLGIRLEALCKCLCSRWWSKRCDMQIRKLQFLWIQHCKVGAIKHTVEGDRQPCV